MAGTFRRPRDFAGEAKIDARWQRNWSRGMRISEHSSSLRFGSAIVQRQGEQYRFEVQVLLSEMDADAVAMQLYAEGDMGAGPSIEQISRGERLVGSAIGFTYTALILVARPAADFTPRLTPRHDGASVPLETRLILLRDNPSWR